MRVAAEIACHHLIEAGKRRGTGTCDLIDRRDGIGSGARLRCPELTECLRHRGEARMTVEPLSKVEVAVVGLVTPCLARIRADWRRGHRRRGYRRCGYRRCRASGRPDDRGGWILYRDGLSRAGLRRPGGVCCGDSQCRGRMTMTMVGRVQGEAAVDLCRRQRD